VSVHVRVEFRRLALLAFVIPLTSQKTFAKPMLRIGAPLAHEFAFVLSLPLQRIAVTGLRLPPASLQNFGCVSVRHRFLPTVEITAPTS
jgi:hypothetical protein